MPVLALGAEKSFGAGQAEELRFVASNVTGGIVPNSGHWIMEENPQATIKLVVGFVNQSSAAGRMPAVRRGADARCADAAASRLQIADACVGPTISDVLAVSATVTIVQ